MRTEGFSVAIYQAFDDTWASSMAEIFHYREYATIDVLHASRAD